MAPPTTPLPPTEARQLAQLEKFLECQRSLKQLLDAQPEAAATLMKQLYTQVQDGFPGVPRPVAVESVLYEQYLQLTTPTGVTLHVLPHPQPRHLASLYSDKPWGGSDFDAPNRLYRYHLKTTQSRKDDTTGISRTQTGTTGSTPTFECFIDGLIRRPDRCYQQALDAFWSASAVEGDPLTRHQWLAGHLANVVAAEAALRVEDQTLDLSDKVLIGQLVAHPTPRTRQHLPAPQRPAAFAPSLAGQGADIPLAGLFIVARQTPPGDIDSRSDIGPVVLFTLDRGIDAFVSLHALDQALRARLADDSLLASIAWQDQARAQEYKANPRLEYRSISDHLFEHRARSLLTLQQQDIAHGWRQLPRHTANGPQVHALFNRLAQLGELLDIGSLLMERSRRYLQANLPRWYRQAGTEDRQTLDRLITAEWVRNTVLAAAWQRAAVPTLAAFARSELIKQLVIDYPGRRIDPDHLSVTLTSSLNPASLGGGIGPDRVPSPADAGSRAQYRNHLSLTALSLRNNDPWNFSFYQLINGERTSMSASGLDQSQTPISLDDAYLRGLIHMLDIGKRYDQLLHRQLIDNGMPLRAAWIDAQRASLASAALMAKLDSDALLEDREHRGYQWIRALVDGSDPAQRPTVGGHKIVANALLIANSDDTRNGFVLNDVLIIGVEKRTALPNLILYTPGAPTGQAFKEFTDRQALQAFLRQQWNTSTDWQRYVLQRLSTAGQAALTESPQSLTRRLSELVLNARRRIGNPFETLHLRPITTALHDALYAQRVYTLRRNADHESTHNDEVEQQSLWNRITLGVDLALNLVGFIPAAVDTARSVTRIFLLLKQASASKSAARAIWSIIGSQGRPRWTSRVGALAALQPAPEPAKPMARLRGGMDPIEKSAFETTYQDYELPPADRTSLPALHRAGPGAFNLDRLNPMPPPTGSTVALHIFGIQARLRRHARTFFNSLTPPTQSLSIPARNASPETLFSHLFNQRSGLVIGEEHDFDLARRFLTDNLAALKRQGVTHLYLEGLTTELHQAPLDVYNGSPSGAALPALLSERLQLLDSVNAQTALYGYTRLVTEAHAQGIQVMAIEATAALLFKPGDLSPSGSAITLADRLDRNGMFNYFAYKKLLADQLALGSYRWVLLVGEWHCNLSQGTPGLVDLTNSISLRLSGQLPTLPIRVQRDPGLLLGTPPIPIKSDLLLGISNATNRWPVDQRVHSPNLFALSDINGDVYVHYMNPQRQRVEVPVFEDSADVYLHHAAFGSLSERRFTDLGALADALVDELGMIQV